MRSSSAFPCPETCTMRVLLVEHLGAQPGEAVDRVVDAQLVPGDRLRRDDHRVAPLDLHGMVAVRDPGQRGQRLSLAAGAEDQHLARPVVVELRPA